MRPLNYPQPGLMAKPDKACVNCKHVEGGGRYPAVCALTKTIRGYDPVTGLEDSRSTPCHQARGIGGSCRPEGIHWVAK